MRITVQRHEIIDSTNLEAARQIARGAADEGLCVVAGEQTSGRGRRGRAWSSPPGAGLYMSLVLRPRFEMNWWPMITLAAAVAVVETLDLVGVTAADIKWPNDVLVGGRKVCGILAEIVDSPPAVRVGGSNRPRRSVVLGIGINVRRDAYPPDLSPAATSLEEVTTPPPDLEKLLDVLPRVVAGRYCALGTPDGRRAILEAWSARSSYAVGCPVRVDCGEGEMTVEGVTRGLDPRDGALRVETADGRVRLIHAGDVHKLRASDGHQRRRQT